MQKAKAAQQRITAKAEAATAEEKAKVQERFEFGGGRCLPEELTHHAGPLPSEMVAKRKERERVRVPLAASRRQSSQ